MPTTIAHMTKKEFSQMVSSIVEQKLIELFGDPDEGLVLKETLRKRLVRQKKLLPKVNEEKNWQPSLNDLALDKPLVFHPYIKIRFKGT